MDAFVARFDSDEALRIACVIEWKASEALEHMNNPGGLARSVFQFIAATEGHPAVAGGQVEWPLPQSAWIDMQETAEHVIDIT